jgi:hypothetical protein
MDYKSKYLKYKKKYINLKNSNNKDGGLNFQSAQKCIGSMCSNIKQTLTNQCSYKIDKSTKMDIEEEINKYENSNCYKNSLLYFWFKRSKTAIALSHLRVPKGIVICKSNLKILDYLPWLKIDSFVNKEEGSYVTIEELGETFDKLNDSSRLGLARAIGLSELSKEQEDKLNMEEGGYDKISPDEFKSLYKSFKNKKQNIDNFFTRIYEKDKFATYLFSLIPFDFDSFFNNPYSYVESFNNLIDYSFKEDEKKNDFTFDLIEYYKSGLKDAEDKLKNINENKSCYLKTELQEYKENSKENIVFWEKTIGKNIKIDWGRILKYFGSKDNLKIKYKFEVDEVDSERNTNYIELEDFKVFIHLLMDGISKDTISKIFQNLDKFIKIENIENTNPNKKLEKKNKIKKIMDKLSEKSISSRLFKMKNKMSRLIDTAKEFIVKTINNAEEKVVFKTGYLLGVQRDYLENSIYTDSKKELVHDYIESFINWKVQDIGLELVWDDQIHYLYTNNLDELKKLLNDDPNKIYLHGYNFGASDNKITILDYLFKYHRASRILKNTEKYKETILFIVDWMRETSIEDPKKIIFIKCDSGNCQKCLKCRTSIISRNKKQVCHSNNYRDPTCKELNNNDKPLFTNEYLNSIDNLYKNIYFN